MSEVNYILSVHPNSSGYIATCDADVHEIEHFEGKIDFNKIKIHGGGGTDFRPLFKKIEEKNIRPSVMVFFTDGDATYPEEAPKYPVMFVIKSKYNKPAPFGISVFFREGENYDVL
jgi:predicted metal-dependent peptidase